MDVVDQRGAATQAWLAKAWAQEAVVREVEVEGAVVRYRGWGLEDTAKPGLVLVHGFMAHARWWDHIAPHFLDRYRVIAPDQIGFGKSSKPEIRYSFADMARNTDRLLTHLGVNRVAVVANSMGGMLGVHFARMYPQRVSALVLENPLGLEDYTLHIPPQATDNLVKLEMAQTPASYRNFVRSYFPVWQPEFERFVEQFARVQLSAEYPRFAKVSALTYQMIYDAPITAELPRLSMPTLLAIGQLDRTVFGRRFAPPEVVAPLGNFAQLGKTAQALIPGSKLVAFEGVGHVPHLEVPERFHAALLQFLQAQP